MSVSTRHWFMLAGLLLLAVGGLLAFYGPFAKAWAIRVAIAALPQPAPRLYLSENELVARPDRSVSRTMRHYLNGKSVSLEWTHSFDTGILSDVFAYDLMMASAGLSQVGVELKVRQSGQDTVLGQGSFTVNSSQFLPYQGQIKRLTSVVPKDGDQLVMRLTVSGGNFGIMDDDRSSISVFKPAKALPIAIRRERARALIWVATNIGGLDTDVFAIFRNRLDDTIIAGNRTKWWFGWELAKSGKPYLAEWAHGVFSVKTITIEEAKNAKVAERSVSWSTEDPE
jgi:hypothetical protein